MSSLVLINKRIFPSFVATFDTDSESGAFAVCAEMGEPMWAAYWDDTEVGIARCTEDFEIDYKVAALPMPFTPPASLTVAVRPQRLVDMDRADWLSISLYVDGRLYIAGSDQILDKTLGNKVGVGAFGSDVCTITDLRIAELHRVIPWTSIDPGETCAAGMNRAIGSTPVFYMARYDGTVRAWMPGNRDVDWSIPTSRIIRADTLDSMFVPAHLRMLGEYHEVDVWDNDIAREQARRVFTVENDPNISVIEEIRESALRAHKIKKEQGRKLSIQLPGMPFVEPHDRIEALGETWRVTAFQYNVQQSKQAPVFAMQIEAQQYIEEDW